MEVLFLVLIAVVLVFGIGVLLVSRARAGKERKPSGPVGTVTLPPPETVGVDVIDEAIVEEAAPSGPVEIVRPRFRDRLAKAQAALAGAFTGVRSRSGITQDSWDDLEEALLRADVGVGVTDALLQPLRARV